MDENNSLENLPSFSSKIKRPLWVGRLLGFQMVWRIDEREMMDKQQHHGACQVHETVSRV